MVTAPSSSRRSSWLSRSSRPPAIFPATASVGLVSPRSTWASIGAEQPLRQGRSRSDRPPASRSALTRGPITIRTYVIAYATRRLSVPRRVSDEPFLRPDVLVLAAGGPVGEAWMTGVLAGLEEATGVDFRGVEAIVGTSAGSIVAASLVAGRSPRRPAGTGGRRETSMPPETSARSTPLRALGALATAATSPLAGPALALGAPAGARARALFLSRLPDEGRSLGGLRREVDGWGTRFDGRLRVCTVDRDSGRRVVFGRPGSPRATGGQAVAASCAVPWIFKPVRTGESTYVDGGAWSLTTLAAAPAGRDS